MDTGFRDQEVVPGIHLRKQLAVAVRSIQWSYAIFWSLSTRKQGVLEWGGGYYNGDIKTRKTVLSIELNAVQMGLQRSEQLRELYESLSAGDTNQQSRRPSASLSPEDLTDAEWYYLVCMSFKFKPGQGMPGRVLATGQSIWLCNAHSSESKVFTRSLLAKSASIKTVVCFPFWNGVVELGVTEPVLEDPNIILRVKTSFLEFPKLICSEQSISNPRSPENDEDPICAKLDHDIGEEEIKLDQNAIEELNVHNCEELKTCSTRDSSSGYEPNLHTQDSYMLEGLNGGASQGQSWQFMDDEFSDCVHGSRNSSDSISQNFLNPEKTFSSLNGEKLNNLSVNDTKLNTIDLGREDEHYLRTLATIFKDPNQLIIAPYFRDGNHKSSFVCWKYGGMVDSHKPPQIGKSQKVLKKILFKVAWMHGGFSLGSREENDIDLNPELLERQKREKLNEKFRVLRSLVPFVSKLNKKTILDDTIEYLKELEERVEELESCREIVEFEARARRKYPDIVERTSDNYGNNGIIKDKKPSIHKRKARDIDETEVDINWALLKDSSASEVTISVFEKEVLIEIKCLWRECLLIDIMEAISNLYLDVHSVQSSTVDNLLSLSLKSKFKGEAVASAGMIKQALQRVIGRC